MKDYSKTIMYKLVGSGMTYYGHTTMTLEQRKDVHISDVNRGEKRRQCTSSQIILAGNFEIVLLEEYPCSNKKEVQKRERWWIENHECVNKQIPGRTKKEWRDDNKVKIAEYQKAYDDARKPERAIYKKAYDKAHKKEIAEYQKAHKKELAEYRDAHKKEKVEYDKKYRETHKTERAILKKAYYEWNKSWDGLNRINI